jgi:hypothetical protein
MSNLRSDLHRIGDTRHTLRKYNGTEIFVTYYTKNKKGCSKKQLTYRQYQKVCGKVILHREDGPAAIFFDGSVEWYYNGKHHREDGPAVQGADGTQEWWLYGKEHRSDGPAQIHPDSLKAGEGEEELEDLYWFVNGELHREDGPAVINFNGEQWYRNGMLDKKEGPAVICGNYYCGWYRKNQLHRLDGPAEIDRGKEDYYIDGVKYTKNKFDKLTKEMKQLNPALGLLDPRWWVREYWEQQNIKELIKMNRHVDDNREISFRATCKHEEVM